MGLNLGICREEEKKAKKAVLIGYLRTHVKVNLKNDLYPLLPYRAFQRNTGSRNFLSNFRNVIPVFATCVTIE